MDEALHTADDSDDDQDIRDAAKEFDDVCLGAIDDIQVWRDNNMDQKGADAIDEMEGMEKALEKPGKTLNSVRDSQISSSLLQKMWPLLPGNLKTIKARWYLSVMRDLIRNG